MPSGYPTDMRHSRGQAEKLLYNREEPIAFLDCQYTKYSLYRSPQQAKQPESDLLYFVPLQAMLVWRPR